MYKKKKEVSILTSACNGCEFLQVTRENSQVLLTQQTLLLSLASQEYASAIQFYLGSYQPQKYSSLTLRQQKIRGLSQLYQVDHG